MNRLTLILVVATALLGLSACNTIKGIGQDVKKTGEVIEGAARK